MTTEDGPDKPEMFPGGWEIERKPTLEMRLKSALRRLFSRS